MDNKPSNTDRMSRPGFGGFFTSCISGYFDVICLYVFYAIGGRMSIPILIKLISEFSVLLYELLIPLHQFGGSFLNEFPEMNKRTLQVVNYYLIPLCLGKNFNHSINIMQSLYIGLSAHNAGHTQKCNTLY